MNGWNRPARELVLAVHSFSRGFAYVLAEGPLSPVDWAVREVRKRDRNSHCLSLIADLVNRHEPHAVVLRQLETTTRLKRIVRLEQLIANMATARGIEVHHLERMQVRATFSSIGAVSRYEVAQAIASEVHAFTHRLPRPRKVWESEDSRMYLFDAAALAMTFYALRPPSWIDDPP